MPRLTFRSKRQRRGLENTRDSVQEAHNTLSSYEKERENKLSQAASQQHSVTHFQQSIPIADSDSDGDMEAEELKHLMREALRYKRDILSEKSYRAGNPGFASISIKESSIILPTQSSTPSTTDLSLLPTVSKPTESQPKTSKRRFLDKTYKTGVFFSESLGNDELFQRDYSVSTGHDKFVDRTELPQFLQKKRRKNPTKYTHLAAEDSSRASDIFKT